MTIDQIVTIDAYRQHRATLMDLAREQQGHGSEQTLSSGNVVYEVRWRDIPAPQALDVLKAASSRLSAHHVPSLTTCHVFADGKMTVTCLTQGPHGAAGDAEGRPLLTVVR